MNLIALKTRVNGIGRMGYRWEEVMSKARPIKPENKHYYETIGMNITIYRKYRNMTQDMLAEKAGISKEHIATIESPGQLKPCSLETLFDIARALGCEPAQLLTPLVQVDKL